MDAKKITKGSTLLATIRSEFPKSTAEDLEKELHEMVDKALNISTTKKENKKHCVCGNNLSSKEIYFGQCLQCDANIQ